VEKVRAIAGCGQIIPPGSATFLGAAVLNFSMRFLVVILTLALAATGCVTRSKARADAQAAYAAGERAAYARIAAAQRTDIFVIGPVQNPLVPWTQGLTLAQAIAAADYIGFRDPHEIILTRRSEQTRIDPKDLLGGHYLPLQPGDTITIRE
jgi:hypothetical protein